MPKDSFEPSFLVAAYQLRMLPMAPQHLKIAQNELRAGLASPAEEFKPRSASQLLDAFHLAPLVDERFIRPMRRPCRAA